MDRNDIAVLVSMLEQSGLSVMEIQQGDFRLRLEKPAGMHLSAQTATAVPAPPQAQSAPPPDIAPARPVEVEEPAAGMKSIKAPMVGIYHDAPSGAVKAGADMKKGAVVCIIEAMKLMNEIVMEEDGVIAWSALRDGDMVEYDQLLFTYN